MTKRKDQSTMFTVAEAAMHLGIGRALAYEAARSGKIPSIRIGRRILVPKAALARFCDLISEHPRSEETP